MITGLVALILASALMPRVRYKIATWRMQRRAEQQGGLFSDDVIELALNDGNKPAPIVWRTHLLAIGIVVVAFVAVELREWFEIPISWYLYAWLFLFGISVIDMIRQGGLLPNIPKEAISGFVFALAMIGLLSVLVLNL